MELRAQDKNQSTFQSLIMGFIYLSDILENRKNRILENGGLTSPTVNPIGMFG